MYRQLPPTATPFTLSDLKNGINVHPQASLLFETALAHYFGVPICRVASTGRTALFTLLHSLSAVRDSPARREIILPAYTCPALVKVVLDVGLQPRLVDVSAHTFSFEADQLEASICGQTLAVVCVHPFGLPQKIDDILKLARARGAVVIEDAAQAMGARLEGRLVGTRGDFGLFSLGPGKPLSLGGGGIVCARNVNTRQTRSLTEAWEELPIPPRLVSGWTLLRLALFTLVFHPLGWWLATRVNLHRVGEAETMWGYKRSGLTDTQASIGVKLLPRLDRINQRRCENAQRLIAHLQELDFVHLPQLTAAAEPIYLRLPLLVTGKERRERLFQQLWAAGIGVGRMYERPLSHIFPAIAKKRYPGAEYVATHLLTLPTHHYLSGTDIAQIAKIFRAGN